MATNTDYRAIGGASAHKLCGKKIFKWKVLDDSKIVAPYTKHLVVNGTIYIGKVNGSSDAVARDNILGIIEGLYISTNARAHVENGNYLNDEVTTQPYSLVAYGAAGATTQLADHDKAWTDIAEIEGLADDTYAEVALLNTEQSHSLLIEADFSSIPDTATITGIRVLVRDADNSGHGVPRATFTTVQWYNGSAFVGSNRAGGASCWNFSPEYHNFGSGDTDMWGLGLTPAMIKAAGWALGLSFSSANALGANVILDGIQVVVFYTY